MIKAFIQSVKALRANPGRTLLTMLGIVIGIASVISMIAIGQGSKDSIKSSIESLIEISLVIISMKNDFVGFPSIMLVGIIIYKFVKQVVIFSER